MLLAAALLGPAGPVGVGHPAIVASRLAISQPPSRSASVAITVSDVTEASGTSVIAALHDDGPRRGSSTSVTRTWSQAKDPDSRLRGPDNASTCRSRSPWQTASSTSSEVPVLGQHQGGAVAAIVAVILNLEAEDANVDIGEQATAPTRPGRYLGRSGLGRAQRYRSPRPGDPPLSGGGNRLPHGRDRRVSPFAQDEPSTGAVTSERPRRPDRGMQSRRREWG